MRSHFKSWLGSPNCVRDLIACELPRNSNSTHQAHMCPEGAILDRLTENASRLTFECP